MRTIQALLVVATAGSAGCVSQPTVSLQSARIAQVSLTGVELAMSMKVRNDNSFDVLVRAIRAEVAIADRLRLPVVQVAPNIWLPAHQETLVVVPVTIPWFSVPEIVQVTLGSNTIGYRAWGSADVTATRALRIGVDDYSFDQKSVIAREELMAAATRGVLGGFLSR